MVSPPTSAIVIVKPVNEKYVLAFPKVKVTDSLPEASVLCHSNAEILFFSISPGEHVSLLILVALEPPEYPLKTILVIFFPPTVAIVMVWPRLPVFAPNFKVLVEVLYEPFAS